MLPHLPPRLQALQKLAYNMWWCWNHDAVALFRRIDADLFEAVEHSPVKLLGAIEQDRAWSSCCTTTASWPTWTASRRPSTPTWRRPPGFRRPTARQTDCRIAYFSAEFGLHEIVPIYSGGLGVLAGDHLKSASDLGIPLVGVGLMYREGYFRQYLNVDGWQQERYPENDFFNLPLIPETKPDGTPLLVSVPFPGREVCVRIWRIQVGRVPLYLLDTNIPQNNADDRTITARLYGGDHDMRIRQEMVLGIGGIRAPARAGQDADGLPHERGPFGLLRPGAHPPADGGARSSTSPRPARRSPPAPVFTTHTPVPAGNDVFAPQLIEHYFGDLSAAAARSTSRSSSAWAGRTRSDQNEPFCMTVLAIRLANITNGVSKLHGSVSRKMWKSIWPELPDAEIPITSITNGVHTPSWLSPEMSQLYDRYLGVSVGGAADRSRHLAARRQHPRRRAVAHPRTPPRTAGGLRPPAAARRSSSAAAPRRPRSPAPTRCSTPRP